jgi:hypothetical protein
MRKHAGDSVCRPVKQADCLAKAQRRKERLFGFLGGLAALRAYRFLIRVHLRPFAALIGFP